MWMQRTQPLNRPVPTRCYPRVSAHCKLTEPSSAAILAVDAEGR